MSTNTRRVFLYVMILITLLNLGFLIAVVVIVNKQDLQPLPVKRELTEKRGRFMASELGFNESQLETFHQSRLVLREEIKPLRNELRRLNSLLIVEATSENPDTSKCFQLTEQIGDLHSEIKQVTTKHIIDVSNIATPDQRQKLQQFYMKVFQDDQPGRRQGKGQQHRFRQAEMPVEE